MRAAGALTLALVSCGAPLGTRHAPATPAAPQDDGRAATADLVRTEAAALDWLSASDPRLAARTGVTASHEVLERIGTAAVLGEDTTMHIVGSSLDVFSFKARARALSEASQAASAFKESLPEAGPVGSELRRPRLEKELLDRLIEEETARVEDEARLGDSAGDLVRALVETWKPPAAPQDVSDRDVAMAAHLLEIQNSLHVAEPRTGPPDLDLALYPLERLLAPLQYPRGTAALARLRIALDQDFRVVPKVSVTPRIVRSVHVHLGLVIDPAALPAEFAVLEEHLRAKCDEGLGALDDAARRAVVDKARGQLFVEASCPPVAGSPVRSMAPPSERGAVCGALKALADPDTRLSGVLALHDEVQLSLAAVTDSPPPRTRLLSRPADEDVDALRRTARERPAVALAPALAAQILDRHGAFEGLLAGGDKILEHVLAAWQDLGEVPLDVLSRELPSEAGQ